MSYQSSTASSGVQILVGLAAMVLGILALVLMPQAAVLTLVGLLAVGAALLLMSATVTGAMLNLFATSQG